MDAPKSGTPNARGKRSKAVLRAPRRFSAAAAAPSSEADKGAGPGRGLLQYHARRCYAASSLLWLRDVSLLAYEKFLLRP